MDETQTEDLYPNDSSYFLPQEPTEQVVGRQKEKAKTLEALAAIKEVIAHFEERIAFRDTLDALNVSAIRSPEMHLRACVTNDLVSLALKEEKQLLEDLLEVHAPNL